MRSHPLLQPEKVSRRAGLLPCHTSRRRNEAHGRVLRSGGARLCISEIISIHDDWGCASRSCSYVCVFVLFLPKSGVFLVMSDHPQNRACVAFSRPHASNLSKFGHHCQSRILRRTSFSIRKAWHCLLKTWGTFRPMASGSPLRGGNEGSRIFNFNTCLFISHFFNSHRSPELAT